MSTNARVFMQDFFGRLPRVKRKSAIKDEVAFSNGEIFGAAEERLSGMSVSSLDDDDALSAEYRAICTIGGKWTFIRYILRI